VGFMTVALYPSAADVSKAYEQYLATLPQPLSTTMKVTRPLIQ
jgi:hypothetical protein